VPWPARSGLGTRPVRDRQILVSRAFLQLAGAATLCALVQYAALVNMVPLLEGRGVSVGLAAWALGLGGAGQVAGRLGYRQLASRLGLRARAAAVIGAVAATTLLLGLLPGPVAALIAASILAGAARGVFTLTQATVVSDYWGPGRYAVLNGVFNAPVVAAGAIAPAVGAGVAATVGSYPALYAILTAIGLGGAVLAAASPAPVPVPPAGELDRPGSR
jgi:MFS family permease